jgi:serine/threonine protein kinase/WD40 repeat protein
MGLPFPIAHLVRRARNAKGPKERHDTAFFAWEASVRIAVAAAPPGDPSVLADPSTGTWVKCLKPSGDALDALPLRKVAVLFASARVEDTQVPRTVSAKKVLEHLAAYRNEVHGHGSTRTGDYYDPAADVLVEAIDAAWDAGVFLEKGKRLVYVESVELASEAARRARIVDLDGIAPLITSPREGTPVKADVAPRRLYVMGKTSERALADLQPVHPWLLYEESELRERVLFFNGRRKSARYLDYVGGEILKGQKLDGTFPNLEEELERTFGQADSAKATSAETPPSDPNRIGDYALLAKLGEGGMGVVHLARQESLGRTVALKVLHPGAADDPIAVARFKREIAALARLDHKNIVSILDSGEDKGRLYYAMELVEGVDLAELVRALHGGSGQPDFDAAMTTAGEAARARTPDRTPDVTLPSAGSEGKKASAARGAAAQIPDKVRTLARLFRDAARAVHYLHGQGMIHRDLKPGNLMVTHADRRIVLMDLGLVAMGNASRSITKDTSSILGTLRYMPPEQLQRNAGDLDRRVDVYALGATFYEVLTGRPLFDGDTEARLVQQVLHEAPPSPRTAATKLPTDLCTILEKCLQKERTQRYDSAEELASDLDAFLDARPISARAPTLSYVALMAARRNKPLTALIALSVLLVFAGLPAWALREKAGRERADQLTLEAEKQRNEARSATARILEEQGRQDLTMGRPSAAFHELALSLEGGNDGPVLRFLLARAGRAATATVREIHAHDEAIASAEFSPDGSHFVTASSDRSVRVFDTATGAQTQRWDLGERVLSASYSDDGSRIVAATKRRVVIYDAAGGPPKLALDEPWDLVTPSLAGDGGTLLVPTWNGEALWVDVANGKTKATLRPKVLDGSDAGEKLPIVATFAPGPHPARALTASARSGVVIWDLTKDPPSPRALPALACDAGRDPADTQVLEIRGETNGTFDDTGARVLAWSGCSHEAHLFDATTGAELTRLHATGVVSAGSFSEGGKKVLLVGDDGRAALHRADTGRLITALHDGGSFLAVAQLAPDGMRVATLGDDDRTRLWDARSGALLAALDGHRAPVTGLDFSKDGTLLLTASDDGVVLLRKADCNWAHASLEHAGEGIALSQDGTTILSWDALGAELVDVATKARKPLGTRAPPPGTPDGAALTGAFAADGTILVGSADGRARVFGKDGVLQRTLEHGGKVTAVAFAGPRLLTAGDDKTVRLWDPGKNEPSALLPHASAVTFATFFDGGKHVLTRTEDDVLTVWNGDTGAMVKTLAHKAAKFADVAAAPAAARFVVPCDDGAIRVFDGNGEVVANLRGTRMEDRRARLSPDGTRALTTSDAKTARIWDVATGVVLFTLEGERSRIADGLYSPDGAFILTSHDDGAARIWDARTGHLLDIAQAHREAVNALGWSGDGTQFFTRAASGMDEELAVWPLPQEKRPLAELTALDALRKATAPR